MCAMRNLVGLCSGTKLPRNRFMEFIFVVIPKKFTMFISGILPRSGRISKALRDSLEMLLNAYCWSVNTRCDLNRVSEALQFSSIYYYFIKWREN